MKSSVELFAISLYEKGFLQGNGYEINDLLEQAKEMHKEEIINAVHLCGYIGGATDEEATEYYILTYGGNK